MWQWAAGERDFQSLSPETGVSRHEEWADLSKDHSIGFLEYDQRGVTDGLGSYRGRLFQRPLQKYLCGPEQYVCSHVYVHVCENVSVCVCLCVCVRLRSVCMVCKVCMWVDGGMSVMYACGIWIWWQKKLWVRCSRHHTVTQCLFFTQPSTWGKDRDPETLARTRQSRCSTPT